MRILLHFSRRFFRTLKPVVTTVVLSQPAPHSSKIQLIVMKGIQLLLFSCVSTITTVVIRDLSQPRTVELLRTISSLDAPVFLNILIHHTHASTRVNTQLIPMRCILPHLLERYLKSNPNSSTFRAYFLTYTKHINPSIALINLRLLTRITALPATPNHQRTNIRIIMIPVGSVI